MAIPLIPVLGTQCFPLTHMEAMGDGLVVMCEDRELCTYVKHHQHKLVLILSAMRTYADELRDQGYNVVYRKLDEPDNRGLFATLDEILHGGDFSHLKRFAVDARVLSKRFDQWARKNHLSQEIVDNPMFMVSLDDYDQHVTNGGQPHMARYYRRLRTRLGVLTLDDGKPLGGRWSFDGENRKKLPKTITPAVPKATTLSRHDRECAALVGSTFTNHPGRADNFWIPTSRDRALNWLDDFLQHRFAQFGPFEDALSTRSDFLFHSALSPMMNVGLLLPGEIIDRATEFAADNDVPLNSLEGFVRQVLGWREFIRATYHRHGAEMAQRNFWSHRRHLTDSWYDGTTGIAPLDDAIRLANERGWNHHIQRLMVIGNLMTLCEIEPRAAYRWFMEMYADSYPWVMEPNVYGMALFSDGGVFATKPYLCGSNYLLKMSDYPRGEWCDAVDGLYWRFIDRHQDYLKSNQRTRMTVNALGRLDSQRRVRIFAAAETFLDSHTETA